MPEPERKSPAPVPSGPGGDEPNSPSEPKVDKPDVNDLLRRMKKVDPEQAKRYRQRTGE